MKKIFLLLTLVSVVIFTSCTKEETIVEENFFLAQTFEVNNTTFNFDPVDQIYFSDRFSYPFEVFESDAVLAYRFEGVDEDGFDVWTQLPQNFFLGNGDVIQYIHLQTLVDVQVLIDGNYDPNALPLEFTDNVSFRFVVVPSEFADANLTMDQAIERFNLDF